MRKTINYYSLLAALILGGCQSRPEAHDVDALDGTAVFCLNEQLKKSTVIYDIEERPITEQLTLGGKIEYDENDLVAFRSLLEGIVEHVHFELGDYVQRGQVLATVKSHEIQDLVQQRKYHQNQIDLLQKQLVTKKELLADGLASAPEVLETEHELASVRIELDRISQSLDLFKAVGQGTFQIIAPKNGYIIQKAISVGQSIIVDSDPLFSISNLKQVWVMVNIYASNLRYVKTGDAVKIRTIAYPDQFYAGKIDKIYNVFDDNEHVLKARVILENKNLNLMPGLSADIIVDKQHTTGSAFAIPNNAKIFSNNKDYVVVYKDDCHLEVRKIDVIASNEEYTYVRGQFAADEKIVVSNVLLLFEQLSQ